MVLLRVIKKDAGKRMSAIAFDADVEYLCGVDLEPGQYLVIKWNSLESPAILYDCSNLVDIEIREISLEELKSARIKKILAEERWRV